MVSLQCEVCSAESATEYGLSATESATLGPESLASEALGRAASPEVVQPASVAVVQPASVADQGASAVEASADSEAAADYPTTVDRLVWASHRRCEMYLAESATGLSEVVVEAGDLAVNSPTRVAQPAHFQLQRFQLQRFQHQHFQHRRSRRQSFLLPPLVLQLLTMQRQHFPTLHRQ